MLIETILKNGYKFVTVCEELYVGRNKITGMLGEVRWKGITRGKPIFLNTDEIVAIVRLDDCAKEGEE